MTDREPPILLIAPYDRYASIDRFVRCLERELSRITPVQFLRPEAVLSRFAAGPFRKALGYVDKFLFFPRRLVREARRSSLVHLVDQSLAVYTWHLQSQPHLLNCNDVIAIRSALGEFPEHRPGWPGRQLQQRILRGVKRARQVVCISEATRADVLRLTLRPASSVAEIPMGLHFPYTPLPISETRSVTNRFIPEGDYLLHVGGNQWYKNRAGVLEIYAELVRRSPSAPNLVLIGEELSPGLRALIATKDLSSRVFNVCGPADEDLGAFYSAARALLFPSLCEGFGWPILEAQACGCPVITTDQAPMTEVGGSAAIYIDPRDVESTILTIQNLLANAHALEQRKARGLENATRFSTQGMVAAYRDLYVRLVTQPKSTPSPQPAFA